MPSVIANFKYNKLKAALRIIFTSGTVYDYPDVPEAAYLGMSNAFQKGFISTSILKPVSGLRK